MPVAFDIFNLVQCFSRKVALAAMRATEHRNIFDNQQVYPFAVCFSHLRQLNTFLFTKITFHGLLELYRQTLFDPFVNVRLGTAYLAELAARYDGDMATALAAYNWGPGHIDWRLQRGRALPTEYPQLVLDAHADRAGFSQS